MQVTSVQLEQGSPLRLTCYTKGTPLIIRVILGTLASLAFLAPVVVLVLMLASGEGFKIRIVVSFLIMWSIGMYLTRMVLWNSFGKEIIEFHSDKLHYCCDYKYFQGNQQDIGRDHLLIAIVPVSETEQTSKLHFTNGHETIEMVLPIPELELIPIKARLAQILNRI